jgi:ATP-dependent DNA helicase RecG
LGQRIEIEEIATSGGAVLVINIPSRPVARAFEFYGVPLMRNGEEITTMDQQTLKNILNEVEPDFAQQVVKGLKVEELDEGAIKIFCNLWVNKSKRKDFLNYPVDKILRSIGVLSDEGLSYACLVLFGTEEILNKFLPDAEIIYEWRQDPGKVNYDTRKSWRAGFFSVYEDLWKVINDRNIRMPFQEGLIQRDIFGFSEKPIREAILNAVAHRNYFIKGRSVFIKASPENFQIESPGAFPDGVTADNILNKTFWRNRIIAETFEKAGLVERSGQGVDDIFNITISEGKGLPSYSSSDLESVVLNIPAQVRDRQFVLFLEKIANQKQTIFSSEELLELEMIRANSGLPKILNKEKFIDLGIVEKVGKTSDSKYILSHEYYEHENHSNAI